MFQEAYFIYMRQPSHPHHAAVVNIAQYQKTVEIPRAEIEASLSRAQFSHTLQTNGPQPTAEYAQRWISTDQHQADLHRSMDSIVAQPSEILLSGQMEAYMESSVRAMTQQRFAGSVVRPSPNEVQAYMNHLTKVYSYLFDAIEKHFQPHVNTINDYAFYETADHAIRQLIFSKPKCNFTTADAAREKGRAINFAVKLLQHSPRYLHVPEYSRAPANNAYYLAPTRQFDLNHSGQQPAASLHKQPAPHHHSAQPTRSMRATSPQLAVDPVKQLEEGLGASIRAHLIERYDRLPPKEMQQLTNDVYQMLSQTRQAPASAEFNRWLDERVMAMKPEKNNLKSRNGYKSGKEYIESQQLNFISRLVCLEEKIGKSLPDFLRDRYQIPAHSKEHKTITQLVENNLKKHDSVPDLHAFCKYTDVKFAQLTGNELAEKVTPKAETGIFSRLKQWFNKSTQALAESTRYQLQNAVN